MEHREQLESEATAADYSVAPAGHAEQNISPYPRPESVDAIAPLRRRLIWDLGIILYGAIGTGIFIQFPVELTPLGTAHLTVAAFVFIVAILIGQRRSEVKVWQAQSILFLGSVFGYWLFHRPDNTHVSLDRHGGEHIWSIIAYFSIFGMYVLGPLSRVFGVPASKIVDSYEAARQSWAAFLMMFPLALSSAMVIAISLDENPEVSFPSWAASCILTSPFLVLWAIRCKSCRDPIHHMTYLWSPILLGTLIIFSSVRFTNDFINFFGWYVLTPAAILGSIQTGIYFLLRIWKRRRYPVRQ